MIDKELLSNPFFYVMVGLIFFIVIRRAILASKSEGDDKMNEDDTEDEPEDETEEEVVSCDECGEDYKDENAVPYFENSGYSICKKCIDKVYPREEKVRVVEKKVMVDSRSTKEIEQSLKDFEKELEAA